MNTKSNPQTQHPELSPSNPEPSLRPRVGKIARLPRAVRERLNQRLDQGCGGEELLPWLNGLKETKQLLKHDFDNRPISKQNLSDWRKGGYAEWCLRRELEEEVGTMAGHARDLSGAANRFIADDLVTLFTARYASLLMRWDGEVSEAFDLRVRLFSRMRRDLLRLQESAHSTALNERQWQQFDREAKAEVQKKEFDQAMAPIKAMMDRRMLVEQYGENIGNAMAVCFERLNYGDHPILQKQPSFFAANPPPERPQEKPKPAPTSPKADQANVTENGKTQTAGPEAGAPNQKSAPGQGSEKTAQAVAAKDACEEKPVEQSRPVKPLFGAMDKADFTLPEG